MLDREGLFGLLADLEARAADREVRIESFIVGPVCRGIDAMAPAYPGEAPNALAWWDR